MHTSGVKLGLSSIIAFGKHFSFSLSRAFSLANTNKPLTYPSSHHATLLKTEDLFILKFYQ